MFAFARPTMFGIGMTETRLAGFVFVAKKLAKSLLNSTSTQHKTSRK
jgi:hypothetical protein